jgi:putative transposase
MNRNWKNYYINNAVHLVTGTVHCWQKVLLYPAILSIFFLDFNRMAIRWDVAIIGFAIMPEHFHMLLQSSYAENVKKFIHGGRRSVSGRVKRLLESTDKAFRAFCLKNEIEQSKFYSKTAGKSSFRFRKEKPRVFPILKEIDIKRKLDYIHNNPVRRGLVKSPEEWEWSSFGFYANGKLVGLPIGSWRQDVAKLPS